MCIACSGSDAPHPARPPAPVPPLHRALSPSPDSATDPQPHRSLIRRTPPSQSTRPRTPPSHLFPITPRPPHQPHLTPHQHPSPTLTRPAQTPLHLTSPTPPTRRGTRRVGGVGEVRCPSRRNKRGGCNNGSYRWCYTSCYTPRGASRTSRASRSRCARPASDVPEQAMALMCHKSA